MASRWDHFIVQIAVLFLIYVLGIGVTAGLIDLLYNYWLLDRETRLLFSTVMMSLQIPYIVFLYKEREKEGGLFWWIVTHSCLFFLDYFWNIHHLFTVHKENGIFTNTFISVYVWATLIVGTVMYGLIIGVGFKMWRDHNIPVERDVLPEIEESQVKSRRLPTIIYEPYKNLPGIVCVCCLKGYKSGHPMKILPTSLATMHSYCAEEWFKMNDKCPKSRKPCGDSEINDFKSLRLSEEQLLQKVRDARFTATLETADLETQAD